MKKLSFYSFGLAAMLSLGALSFSSCTKETTKEPAKPAVQAYTATLGAQTNNAPSFFSTSTGVISPTSDSATFNTKEVNLSFGQTGSTFTAKFISLDQRKAQGLNRVVTSTTVSFFEETMLTKAQFDTAAFIIQKIVSSANKVVDVKQGKVYKFVSGNSRALIYVSNLTTVATNASGTVSIDVRRIK